MTIIYLVLAYVNLTEYCHFMLSIPTQIIA